MLYWYMKSEKRRAVSSLTARRLTTKVRSSERREQDAALPRRKRQIFVPFRQAARRPDGANHRRAGGVFSLAV